ncbi:MAG: methionine--tRNA ligase subunit beta [Planctomycetota bacterium]|jgi:methionyl-tRNA synthetase
MNEENNESCDGCCGCPGPVEENKKEVSAYDPADELISIEDFMKVKLRVAEILEAGPHPDADKLLLLKIKVGEREKQLCAGIKKCYSPDDLIGKRIVVVDNLKPAKLRGVESQGMLLAASDGDDIILLTTDKADMPSGSPVK